MHLDDLGAFGERHPRQAEAAVDARRGLVEAVGGQESGVEGRGEVGGDLGEGDFEELGEEGAGGFAALGALAGRVLVS